MGLSHSRPSFPVGLSLYSLLLSDMSGLPTSCTQPSAPSVPIHPGPSPWYALDSSSLRYRTSIPNSPFMRLFASPFFRFTRPNRSYFFIVQPFASMAFRTLLSISLGSKKITSSAQHVASCRTRVWLGFPFRVTSLAHALPAAPDARKKILMMKNKLPMR